MQRFDPQLVASLAGLQLKARCVMEGFLSGIHGSPFHGPSVEFSEYREYQPGDDLRRVDWRLYARADRLYVKQYEAETNARWKQLQLQNRKPRATALRQKRSNNSSACPVCWPPEKHRQPSLRQLA